MKKNTTAKVISIINLKGGVGKTTTTIALGDFLTTLHDKKVLIIDLDPQTNATTALIDENKWKKLDEAGKTLKQLFKSSFEEDSSFNIKEAIAKNVSRIKKVDKKTVNLQLDLLPSSLGLIEIQEEMNFDLIARKSFYTESPIEILHSHIKKVINEYDFILIDCPPSLGIITKNGLFFSDYYLIPTIPDDLSMFGIPQILTMVEDFNEKLKLNVEPLGILCTKFQEKTHEDNKKLLLTKHQEKIYIFNANINQTKEANEKMIESEGGSLASRYGSQDFRHNNEAFTNEFLKRIEELEEAKKPLDLHELYDKNGKDIELLKKKLTEQALEKLLEYAKKTKINLDKDIKSEKEKLIDVITKNFEKKLNQGAAFRNYGK